MQRAKLPIQAGNIPHAWNKTLIGTIKCNVDATSCNNSIMGYGICFGDFSRSFMFDKSDYLYSFTRVLEAEAIALFEGIKVAILNGINVVFFETDCKSLADALATNTNPPNEFGDLSLSVEVSYLLDPNL